MIKDGDKIIARSTLRLLWDGEQPVIYRERFYPDTIPVNFQTALNTVVKKIATKLGVPLTSNDTCTPYGKDWNPWEDRLLMNIAMGAEVCRKVGFTRF